MSDARQSEELLERIVRAGEPRRRIPPLRMTLALWAMLSAVVAGLYLRFWVGLRPDFALRLGADFHFAGIWVGLSVLAAGAALWALAASVPGRSGLERIGRAIAALGAVLGFVLAPVAILLQSGGAGLHANMHDFVCMGGAFRIAALPGVALVAWVLWAAPARPGRTALCAALGSGALGAAMIHATCPDSDAAHWLVGHASAPIMLAALVAVPVWCLARWHEVRRRSPL